MNRAGPGREAPSPGATPQGVQPAKVSLTHLQRLEAESIHIFREVVAECDRPVMLYSVGKDSAVMLHLAVKAFHPKIVIPYHYRGSDLAVFQKGLEGTGIEVRLLDWYPK